MKNSIILPILLQVAGVIVIIAEIILPSGGLLSLLAVGVLGYSLYYVFNSISTQAGFIFVAADIVLLPILLIIGIKLLAKSPVTLKKNLSSGDGVSSQSPELEQYTGQEGVAISNLRPSGTALISGKKVDVVSRGEYIDKNSKLIVSSVKGNQIIVSEVIENNSRP